MALKLKVAYWPKIKSYRTDHMNGLQMRTQHRKMSCPPPKLLIPVLSVNAHLSIMTARILKTGNKNTVL